MENCIIFDWLTFSSKDISVAFAEKLLGLQDCNWDTQLPSSLRYAYRNQVGGISIHWTPDDWEQLHPGIKRNEGLCVEMSGQGCREFETYGRGDFPGLIQDICLIGCHIARLDLAYDDFEGKIDICQVARQATDLHFTSRMSKREVIRSVPDLNPDHDGLTITHGSRSSNIMIRIYDKRCERQRYELDHWIRCEIQFRHDDADGVALRLNQGVTVGNLFSGVLRQYLNYRDQTPDSNKSRWPISDWWQDLINDVDPITVHQKKDVVYNRDKLESYVFGQAKFGIVAALALDGTDNFLEKAVKASKTAARPMPKKYRDLFDQAEVNNLEILREIGVIRDDA